VHPFFALENARRMGAASELKNVSEDDLVKDYALLKLGENWKREIIKVEKNPRAILVIFGLRGLETSFNAPPFFKKGLTKSAFESFSAQYRELIGFARERLGRRLIYLSGGRTQEGRPSIVMALRARLFTPAKKVRVEAFGEYLGKTKIQCVDACSEFTKGYVGVLQNAFYPNEKTAVSLRKLLWRSRGTSQKLLSIKEREGLLFVAEARRELRKKGRLSDAFLKNKIRHPMSKSEREMIAGEFTVRFKKARMQRTKLK